MDFLGTTTAVYFWSKEEGGLEDLKELAEAWKTNISDSEVAAAGRFRFVSVNLDDLSDAGESILRSHGLDWPALRMEGGKENPIYKAYCRFHPRVLRISPTGYAAMYLTSSRAGRGYERNLQSWLARQWTRADYNSHLQSIFAGEFLIIPTEDSFDPAAPPELKATVTKESAALKKLKRTDSSVPEEQLKEIQACFIAPPIRYLTRLLNKCLENYEKADILCRKAISSHPNRHLTCGSSGTAASWPFSDCGNSKANTGTFASGRRRSQGQRSKTELPKGADTVIARFCLARESLRNADIDPEVLIRDVCGGGRRSRHPPRNLPTAALLALDVGERKLHEEYRRAYLDAYAEHPSHVDDRRLFSWIAIIATGCITLHLSQVGPTVRRQGHFLGIGETEDANRTVQYRVENTGWRNGPLSREERGQVDNHFLCIECRSKAAILPGMERLFRKAT